MEAFPDDFCLEEKGILSLGYSRAPALLLGAHAGPPLLTKCCQDPTHALHDRRPG